MARKLFFNRDKAEDMSVLRPPEIHFQKYLGSKVPPWLETYHLTLMTIPFAFAVPLFGFLARSNIQWMWGVSLMIVFQYFTDLVDGEVGRQRNTGLIKWGYFMDHFLDYCFTCAVLAAYGFVLPLTFAHEPAILFVVAIGFLVNTILAFAATGEFRMSVLGIGPTECRIGFILFNAALIFPGRDVMLTIIPYATVIFTCGLIYIVYRTQRQLWRMDMDAKRARERNQSH
ncbi:hypothetical protein HZA45_00265 [Candidatus Peregrinibacteria bacterium]|nr:hypothetical protein [Candidatus Peregrinibacteria bacterium]